MVNPTIENFIASRKVHGRLREINGGEYVSSVLKNWMFDGNSQAELFYLADPRAICNVSFKHIHTPPSWCMCVA